MKTTIIAVCVLILNGCPFLPPNPYGHVGYGVYPASSISLPVGEDIKDAEELSIPGLNDIVGVSSELNGETLSATFYLRELPKNMQWGPDMGHMQDFKIQWIVMIEIEGDSSTPFEWHDYLLNASYYDPEIPRITLNKIFPQHPWVITTMQECAPGILEKTGEEYNSCIRTSEPVELTFSYEENSLTLSANIPGITEASTVAFWVWGHVIEGMVIEQEYVPNEK